MTQNDFIQQSMMAIRLGGHADKENNKIADSYLVAHAQEAMTKKLKLCREKGRAGWWNKDECKIEHLRQLLAGHIIKGDMVDVMNLAAMIYVREIADDICK